MSYRLGHAAWQMSVCEWRRTAGTAMAKAVAASPFSEPVWYTCNANAIDQ